MVTIENNLNSVKQRIAAACLRSHRDIEDITLIAVTKNMPANSIQAAFDLGIINFGENRVQEAHQKIQQLCGIRDKILWHMIGHLQTNKVKLATGLFDMIHSVDSIKLAGAINQSCVKPVPVLLEINVSGETTKGGFTPDAVPRIMAEMEKFCNLKIEGFMTVAPIVNNPEEVRPVFKKLRHLKETFKLNHLSMGMTDDFEVAIEEGSTMVRIGRAVFGKRRNQ